MAGNVNPGMRKEWDSFWSQKDPAEGHISWSKRRIMATLDRYLTPGLRVLDAGCGSGFFSHYFILRGCETYCLDYSPEALNLTRTSTQGRAKDYMCVNLLDETFANNNAGRFDVIFSDGLFEHFTDAEQDRIFMNFRKMKKKGGKIITFVPNKYTLWWILQPFYMPGIKEQPLSVTELSGLYERNSCRVEDSGGLNVIPVAFSPEFLGRWFGMLVYCVGG